VLDEPAEGADLTHEHQRQWQLPHAPHQQGGESFLAGEMIEFVELKRLAATRQIVELPALTRSANLCIERALRSNR
jgi:hypothetical protein